jgi:transcriptional regulator with XRE-family HTH domain
MENRLGTFLREMRTARQMSLGRLAQKAAVSKSTLSTWESGAHLPRLPELEVVLAALGASPQERRWVISLIDAPRAAVRLRGEATKDPSGREPTDAYVLGPCVGDLLRALRHRQRLTLQALAERLGVPPSTVSRWEAGKNAPSKERMDALLSALQANPEERIALQTNLPLFAPPPGSEETTAQTLDACAAEIDVLAARTERGEYHLMDLRYLSLEARLGALARINDLTPTARRLLAETYAWHAQWLSYRGRIREAGPRAYHALDMAKQELSPEPFWLRAVHVSVVYDRDVRHAPAGHLIESYRRWLPAAVRAEDESRLWRDMANAASMQDRQIEDAFQFIAQALEAAQRSEHDEAVWLAQSVHVNIFERAGRPVDALNLLASMPSPCDHRAYDIAVKWARLLLAQGNRSEAQEWLSRAYRFADDYALLPEAADRLALRL